MASNKGGSKPSQEEMDWMAQEDVRTLARAAEIRSDKDRLRRARECAKKQLATIRGVMRAR